MNACPPTFERLDLRPKRRGGSLAWEVGIVVLSSAMLLGGCHKKPEAKKTNGQETSADTAMRYVDAPSRLSQTPPAAKFIAADHPAPRPTEALAEDASCVTPECHASFGVADRLHGPLAAGDCFVCHATDTGGHVYPLLREGDRTCNFCHQVGNTRQHRHAALDEPGCMGCHDPHAGRKFLLLEESVDQTCLTCHVLDEGKHPHGPYAALECAACHQPHESNNAKLLRGGEGAEHCYACHTDTKYVMANAPYVHAPASQDCTACHSAHASDFESHLKKPTDELCLDCHTGLEAAIATSSTAHAAVFTGDSCANCHDAHASGRPRLLRDRQTTLCLSCHSQQVVANDGRKIPDMTASVTGKRFLHGPVETGDCSACHNVHGSTHDRLLRQNFPTGFYSKFDLANYALCFSCHPQELVLSEKTTSLTDFRDGDRNLHYLHTHKDDKGRSCKTCHAIHGSDLPRHVATEVPFENSTWMMPVGFERLEDGGKCAPGCHVAIAYHRGPTESGSSESDGVNEEPGGQP